MRNTYFKVLVLLFILVFGTIATAQAQTPHNHEGGKRIKILNPTQNQLETIASSGIDLKCGAEFTNDALYLELSGEQLEIIETANINFNVVIDDLISFHAERNATALPAARQQLAIEKQMASSRSNDQITRSLSTTSTSISNVIQYEGATEIDWAVPQNFELGASMGGCLTVSEVNAQLDRMRALYPNLISVKKDASLAEDGSGTPIVTHGNNFTNGGQYDTWEGQTIYYVRISDNPDSDEPNEPESFYSGMTHSREVSSMMNLMYYMWYVLENYETDPDIKNLVDNNEMYFVPIANPDGLRWNEERAPGGGGLQRKNLNPNANTEDNFLRGVDLNRNYSYLWGTAFGGSSGLANTDTYRGTAPFSEPETQIVERFTANHDVKTALNHHATSNLLPHGYNGEVGAPPSGREDDYAQFCQDLTRFNRYIYGEAPNILTVANGDMSDWFLGGPVRTNSDGSTSSGSGKGILALAPENGDPSSLESNPDLGSGFWPSPDQIVNIAKRAMRMNFVNALYAGKTAQLHDITPSNLTATTGNLTFGVEYLGMTLSDLTLTVTPVSANITSIGTVPALTGWTKQEQRQLSVAYTLDGGIATNDPIEYQVTLSNDTNIIYQANITKYYSPAILFTDVPNPTSLTNWTASSDWATTADGFNGTRGITNDPTPPYAANRNATLTLNTALNLSSVNTAVIQFNAKWDMERNFDYAQIQASIDGGATWIGLSGKYTKPGSTLSSTRYSPVGGSGSSAKTNADRDNQPDGRPVYEGYNDDKWVLEEIEISNSANSFAAGASNLQLRFLFDSDSNNNTDGYTTTFDGFTFDNFTILNNITDRSCIDGVEDTPHVQNFEEGLASWTQNIEDDGDLTLGSGQTPSANTGPNAAFQGEYYMFAESSNNNIGIGSNATAIITSPCLNIDAAVEDITFNYHMFGAATGSLELQVKPSTNTTWTSLFTRTGQQSTSGTNWRNGAVDITAYQNTTVQFRFIVTTGNGATSDIALDNVRITPPDTTAPTAICQNIAIDLDAQGNAIVLASQIDNGSTDNVGIETISIDVDTFDCSNVGTNTVTLTVIDFNGLTDTCTATVTVNPYITSPSGLSANSITGTTATLAWDATQGEDYRVRFRESGTTTWIPSNVTTNSIDLTGLTELTTYEAQVRANCATGNTPYSASVEFTTLEEQLVYCESEGSTQFANGITGVSFGSINSTSTAAPAYTDFTSLSTTVITETNYDLTVSISTLGTQAQNHFTRVWIDWNRNGTFDASEEYDLGTDNGKTGQPTDSSPFSITVPVNATPGVTRMRVSINFASAATPCQTGFFGEVEDYTIIVEAAPTDYVYDAGVWTPSDPSGIATSADNIQVISGTGPLTVDTDINMVTIFPGATLDLGTTKLSVSGNYINSGSTIGSQATLTFNGTTQQGVIGSALEIGSLIIDNSDATTGVVLSAPLTVNTLLTLTNGTLNTANNLTLSSNASGTAMVDVVTGGSILGNVTTQRYIPAKRAFRLLSSPVTSTTSINENWQEGVNNTGTSFPTDNMNPNPGFGTHITGSLTGADGFDATGSGNASIFKLNNAGQAWVTVPNTDVTTLTAGEPVRLLVRGDRSINVTSNSATPTATTLRATGTLATSTVTVTGTNLNHNAGAFNFVGNPYQATVNMNDVLSGSTNLATGQIWVWDATLGDRGQYITVSLDGTGSSNGANTKNYHFIQPGQAVFTATEATVSNNATAIVFNETDKAIGNDVTIFSNEPSAFSGVPHIITKLYRTDRYGLDVGLQDNFVILYDDNYSNEVTPEDVSKFFNIDENMGVYREGSLLSIDRLEMPTEEDEIQLYNALYRVSDYTLDVDVYGLDNVTPYLQDNFTGELTALDNGLNTINFTVDTEVEESVDTNRFKIVYEANALSAEDEDIIDVNLYPNPVTNGTLTITSTELAGSDVTLSLTNLLGQKVLNEEITFNGTSAVINNLNRLSSGMYILSITSEEVKVSHKIVIQ